MSYESRVKRLRERVLKNEELARKKAKAQGAKEEKAKGKPEDKGEDK